MIALKQKFHEIYMLWADSPDHEFLIKIGQTTNMKNRIRNIQSGCPFNVRPFIAFQTIEPGKDERLILDQFSEYQLRGEWFNLPVDVFDELVLQFRETQQMFRMREREAG